jgi:hypothetical protein
MDHGPNPMPLKNTEATHHSTFISYFSAQL